MKKVYERAVEKEPSAGKLLEEPTPTSHVLRPTSYFTFPYALQLSPLGEKKHGYG